MGAIVALLSGAGGTAVYEENKYQKKIKILQDKIDRLQRALAEKQEELADKQREIAALHQKLAERDRMLAKNLKDQAETDTIILKLKTDQKKMQSFWRKLVAFLTFRLGQLRKEKEQVERELAKANERLSSLIKEKEKIEEAIKALELKNKEAQQIINGLEQLVADLRSEVNKTKKEIKEAA